MLSSRAADSSCESSSGMQNCCPWQLGEIFLVPILLGVNLGKSLVHSETLGFAVKSLCVCLASV